MSALFDPADDAELLAAVLSADRGERGRALLRLSRRYEARMVMTAYDIGRSMYDEVLHNLDPVRQMTVRHAADKAAVGEISLQLSMARSKAGFLFNLGAALHQFPKIKAAYLDGDHSTHRVSKLVRAAQSVPDATITDEWIREFGADEAGGAGGGGVGDGAGCDDQSVVDGGADVDVDAEVPATLHDALADAESVGGGEGSGGEGSDGGDGSDGEGRDVGDDDGGGDDWGDGCGDDAVEPGDRTEDGSPALDFEDFALDLASRPTTDTALGNALDAVVISMDPDRAAEVREEFGRTYQNVIVTTDASGHASIDACVPAEDGLRISRRIADLIHDRVCPGDPRTLGQQRVAAFAEITRKRGARLACECGRPDCRATVKSGKGASRTGGPATSGAALPSAAPKSERSVAEVDVAARAHDDSLSNVSDGGAQPGGVDGGDLDGGDLDGGDGFVAGVADGQDASGHDVGEHDVGAGHFGVDCAEDVGGRDVGGRRSRGDGPRSDRPGGDSLDGDGPELGGSGDPGDANRVGDDPEDGTEGDDPPAGDGGPDDAGPDSGGSPGGASGPVAADDEPSDDSADDDAGSTITLILDPTLIRPPHLRGYGAIDPALAAELAPRATIIGPPSSDSVTRRTSGVIVTDRTPPPRVDATGHGGFDRPPPGALTYAPSPRLRAEVEYSDLTCRYPLCTRPSHECQLDHLVPFNHADPMSGGWTLLDNIIPLCTPDHQRKHLGIWIPVMHTDRTVIWRNAQSGYEITTHPS